MGPTCKDASISHAIHRAQSHDGHCTKCLSQLHLHCLQVAHCSDGDDCFRIPYLYFAEHTDMQRAAEAPVLVQHGMLMEVHFVRCQNYFCPMQQLSCKVPSVQTTDFSLLAALILCYKAERWAALLAVAHHHYIVTSCQSLGAFLIATAKQCMLWLSASSPVGNHMPPCYHAMYLLPESAFYQSIGFHLCPGGIQVVL